VSSTEKALQEALKDLDGAITQIRAIREGASVSQKPDLLSLFRRIEGLAETLPPETSPELRHYLARKSYEKARLWLESAGNAAAASQG
jgi:hypothetical protein